jgi:hypothetical protein
LAAFFPSPKFLLQNLLSKNKKSLSFFSFLFSFIFCLLFRIICLLFDVW